MIRWGKSFSEGFDLDEFNAHIRTWQEIIGIPDYEIRFSLEQPANDDGGPIRRSCVDIDTVQRRAAIRIRNDCPISQVDRQIVHELLHVLHAQMEDTFRRTLDAHGAETQAFFRGQWERSSEWVIERLTNILSATERQEWPVNQPGEEVWTSAFPVE